MLQRRLVSTVGCSDVSAAAAAQASFSASKLNPWASSSLTFRHLSCPVVAAAVACRFFSRESQCALSAAKAAPVIGDLSCGGRSFAATRLVLADVRNSGGRSKGERRLSFDERSARRTRTSKEDRDERESHREEAEQFCEQELPQELESTFARSFARATIAKQKVTHPALAVESVEVEVSPGVKKPVSQISTLLKISPTELHVIPMSANFVSPIISRILKHDSSLSPVKFEGKIKLTVMPMTKESREKAAAEIDVCLAEFGGKLKAIRNSGVHYLQRLEGLDQDSIHALQQDVDQKYRAFLEEKAPAFAELKEQTLAEDTEAE